MSLGVDTYTWVQVSMGVRSWNQSDYRAGVTGSYEAPNMGTGTKQMKPNHKMVN